MKTVCPHCGAALPPRALACPECGSDEHTGWSDSGIAGTAPYEAFDDDDYTDLLEREFGVKKKAPRKQIKTIVMGIIAALLALMLVLGRL